MTATANHASAIALAASAMPAMPQPFFSPVRLQRGYFVCVSCGATSLRWRHVSLTPALALFGGVASGALLLPRVGADDVVDRLLDARVL